MILGYDQIMKVDNVQGLPSSASVGQLALDMSTMSTYQFNGTGWIPLGRVVIKKSTVVIDGKVTGSLPIYTLEASPLNFYPTQVIVRAISISGATLKPTISIGSNSSNYDNIASGSLLNTVTSLLGITSQPLTASSSPALAGITTIYANVTIGAIATSYTFKVDILGYYES